MSKIVKNELLSAMKELMKTSNTFSSKEMQKVTITKLQDGCCECEFKVDQTFSNEGGTLHGGFTATLVDILTTWALMSHPKASTPGVSVDLHTKYLKGVRIGEDVVASAQTIRVGRNLAFLEMSLRFKKNNEIFATGTHTKFVGGK